MEVYDFGAPPLPPLLLVVVALDGAEEGRAGGRGGQFVTQRRRVPLPGPGGRGVSRTHTCLRTEPGINTHQSLLMNKTTTTTTLMDLLHVNKQNTQICSSVH